MRLSIDSGKVVCSLENKNSEFLAACAGIFGGLLNGRLKVAFEDPNDWAIQNGASLANAEIMKRLLYLAKDYGVDIDGAVIEFNEQLQSDAEQLRAAMRAEEEFQEKIKEWKRLCNNGCGKCRYLKYYIDVPICEKTGQELEEKNVRKYIGGVLHLFNMTPFPSDDCPFNIKDKGAQ